MEMEEFDSINVSLRPAGDKQQSTGLLHLDRFKSLSFIFANRKRRPWAGGDGGI